MGNCFFRKESKLDKFIKEQLRYEYKHNKVSINKLGSYKPHSCYCSNSLTYTKDNIIIGLNSMCNFDIHISIAENPLRMILSYLAFSTEHKALIKGDTFHIYKINYKTIKTIEEITQYDIYNAIQDYIYVQKTDPNNTHIMVAV